MATQTFYEIRDGYVQTTDATPTAIVTFDVTTGGPGGTALTDCSIFIQGDVAGFSTSATAAGGRSSALFKVTSGTLAKVGATVTNVAMIKDTGGGPNDDFSASGSTITYSVTGVNAVTINWFGRMFMTIYQP